MDPTTPPRKPLRVLCLHGFRTNAAVMANQTKSLRAALGDNAEFIFLNGPREAVGPSDDTIERLHAKDKPFYEWWLARKADARDEGFSPDDKAWTWAFQHFDEAVEYMEKKLKELGPVDVVLGFSQGSLVLTVLSMLFLQRDVANQKRWWKMCICVGGVAVRALSCRYLFETPDGRPIHVPFPSIHVVGKKDIFYKDGLRLAEQYDSCPTTASRALTKRLFVHEGGHKFPSAEKNPGLYEEIAQLILEHCHESDSPLTASASRL